MPIHEKKTIVFVVSPGRSGQSSFAKILEQAFPESYVGFEEPQIKYFLPRQFAYFERSFRRKFLETDELLGRGRVLKAFEKDDKKKLRSFGLAKHNWIMNKMRQKNVALGFEVNKHFLHGLHIGMAELKEVNFKMIQLVRDPIENMRSFLNRNKNFLLDNSSPGCQHNELILDPKKLSKGQHYLHAWCECYLRAEKFCAEQNIELLSIYTRDLQSPDIVRALFQQMGLPFHSVSNYEKTNTNQSKGFTKTVVESSDLEEADLFWKMVPRKVKVRIPKFD